MKRNIYSSAQKLAQGLLLLLMIACSFSITSCTPFQEVYMNIGGPIVTMKRMAKGALNGNKAKTYYVAARTEDDPRVLNMRDAIIWEMRAKGWDAVLYHKTSQFDTNYDIQVSNVSLTHGKTAVTLSPICANHTVQLFGSVSCNSQPQGKRWFNYDVVQYASSNALGNYYAMGGCMAIQLLLPHEEEYDWFMPRAPKNAPIVGIGMDACVKGNWSNARECSEKAIAQHADLPEAWALAATVEMHEQNFSKAAAYLDKAAATAGALSRSVYEERARLCRKYQLDKEACKQ